MKQSEHPVGKVVVGGEPKLTIRIIGRCNFRCPVCSTFSSPDRKGILSFEDFKRAVDILAKERFVGVLNISGGEPTLHRQLPRMAQYASEQLPKASIVVFTNGYWIGRPSWRQRLRRLLAGPNVLVRFSLDRQHAEGEALASDTSIDEKSLREIEMRRLNKARAFLEACLEEHALPGRHFDFAFKGTVEEARCYMSSLGLVPVYPIRLQKTPSRRPKEMGYCAIDIDEKGEPSVFLTLGHIPIRESFGGIESLPLALRLHREALNTKCSYEIIEKK